MQLTSYLTQLRLRTILTVPFIIQIVLAVGLTGYLSLYNGHVSIQEFIGQSRHALTQKIHDHLDLYLQEPVRANHAVINSLELGVGNTKQPRTLEALFQKTMHDFPSIAYIQLGTKDGAFFGYERLEDHYHIEVVDAETRNVMQTYETNEQGYMLASPIRTTSSFDLYIRPWYAPVAEQKRALWSDVFVYFSHSRLAVTISHPVVNQQNQLLGVVGSDLALTDISQYLQSLKIGKTGQAFIIERQTGLMVANSAGEQPFNSDAADSRLPIVDSQSPLIAKTAQYLKQHFKLFEHIQQPYLIDFEQDGEHYYVEVTPYQDNMGLDWLVTVVIPESDFMEYIEQNRRLTIVMMIVALVVAIGVGFMTAHWVVTPIKRLNIAAKALEKGDWSHQIDTKHHSRNEIGELAQAFDGMARQLKEVFENLELKVSERTQDLEQANAEIQALNQYLQQENVRMGTELDITRQLQKMVLPRRTELEQMQDLDISVYMQPATEVGGDYYDIIEYGDTIKVAIGDVTGHGLTSGVLMLMVQSAVRTLFMNDMCNPEVCLNIINRTIYNNVQRMQIDKNLSLVLLGYQYGHVEFVGQHEEVLIVRRDGTIERFDTIDLGFPVGLEENIEAFVHRAEVDLDQGDGIILYTDGITEAENKHKQFYGSERLCKMISEHWSLSAKKIQQLIIQDVKHHIADHKVYDDLTLLVIKRKVI
ncbi:SpoIIE family protein phosphatase [Candidatus Albibeggiatoa sp. nov. NOAA]|uniref:SpoIIE family protein phosphatase n=1 Tax=Candidatus Albibeggiatoa sp. nov. NOAA TaxID=3162724 RepID=UPI0032FC6F5A|nr:SpoIIE family protein phosphatase [Thiotrichaceae bacterium]